MGRTSEGPPKPERENALMNRESSSSVVQGLKATFQVGISARTSYDT